MGIRDWLAAMDDRALKATGFASPPPTPEVREAKQAATVAKVAQTDARRTTQARLAVRYQLGLTALLLIVALFFGVTGDSDTAVLFLGFAVIAGLAAGARFASARWARRM